MDILSEFRTLFLKGGLESWIHSFRNPNPNEDFYDYLELKYNSDTDSREYTYEDSHPRYNPFSDGWVSITISEELKNWLERREKIFKRKLEELEHLIKNDEDLFTKVTNDSAIDFSEIRKWIKGKVEFSSILNVLLIHVGVIEQNYISFIAKGKQMFTPENRQTKKNTNLTVISFGFRSDIALLRSLYYDLRLNNHDFINQKETPIDDFIAILTATNVAEVPGKIQFACETRQAAYIINMLNPFFSNLKSSSIEKSQKFFSKNGTVLKAVNLIKSLKQPTNVNDVGAINQFFKGINLR